MTVSEIIGKVDHLRPNQMEYDDKIEFLSDLELMLINEVILTHEIPEWVAEHETYQKYILTNGREPLHDKAEDGELLIPAPYGRDVYYWYLVSRMDVIEGDADRYENDFQMYNNALLTYKDWYNRTYMPLQPVKSFMKRG